MKTTIFICIILSCMVTCTAFATSDIIEIACDQSFILKEFCGFENGNTQLAGFLSRGDSWQPVIYCLNESCEVIWTFFPDTSDLPDGLYYAIASLNTVDSVGLRFHSDETEAFSIVEIIQNGASTILARVEDQVFQICPSIDGVVYTYLSSHGGTLVAKIDFDNQLVWEHRFDVDVNFTKIVDMTDGYACIGYFYEDENSWPIGLIAKLSNEGDISWMYHFDEKSQFLDGILVDRNDVVVVGDTLPEEGAGLSFIARYSQNGLVWKTERSYIKALTGRTSTVINNNGQYIVACKEVKQYGEVYLTTYDDNGIRLTECIVSTGQVNQANNFLLKQSDDSVRLLVNGAGHDPTISKTVSIGILQ